MQFYELTCNDLMGLETDLVNTIRKTLALDDQTEITLTTHCTTNNVPHIIYTIHSDVTSIVQTTDFGEIYYFYIQGVNAHLHEIIHAGKKVSIVTYLP